ncbi:MAG: hypothetical protein H8E14_08250 [Candidatus Marinimicrobia bacterium]|nr:hypothetical protein [Candidatus Neomarinimicrobiota bacterium]
MTLPQAVRLLIATYILLLINSCTRDPIITSINNADLIIVDTVLYNIDSFTYQIPPDVGTLPNLYFGSESGYNCRFTLVNISSQATDNSTTFQSFIDTTVGIERIDSVFFIMTSPDTFLADDAGTYHLLVYPDADLDSVFSEGSGNYLNIDTSTIVGLFGTPLATTLMTKIEDTVATHPLIKFDLTDSKDIIIQQFADTIGGVKNRSLVIWHDENNTGISEFYSRNANNNLPRLEVQFRKIVGIDSLQNDIIDTLAKSFYPDKDVSIIYPPLITVADTSAISIGRAKGLQAILSVVVNTQTLPKEAVIRSAELTLYQDSLYSDINGFTAGVYSIDTAYTDVLPYPISYPIHDDPIDRQIDLPDPVVSANQVVFELRNLLGAVALGQVNNYGIKLFSTSANDPFEIAHFEKDTAISNAFRPSLRVIYVSP